MHKKTVERWSPWILLAAIILLWQIICSAFSVPEYLFPSPWAIGQQLVEFGGVIAGHAWRTYWVTMAGFGIAIVVGVLMPPCTR
jgi:NitT/TauT family transport system permease protein